MPFTVFTFPRYQMTDTADLGLLTPFTAFKTIEINTQKMQFLLHRLGVCAEIVQSRPLEHVVVLLLLLANVYFYTRAAFVVLKKITKIRLAVVQKQ